MIHSNLSKSARRLITLSFVLILTLCFVVFLAPSTQSQSNPSDNFLYLPFRTSSGDWLTMMTSAFDHHYPDFTCAQGPHTDACKTRGMQIVIWEGEVARPVQSNNTAYCYKPGSTVALSPDVCGYISGYHGATGESHIFYDGHDGYDWALPGGSAILAAASGKVVSVGEDGNYGWTVRLDHNNGYITAYSHLERNAQNPTVNSIVNVGDQIGVQGCTGNCHGAHLHFRVFHNGKVTDPFGWCYYCNNPPTDPLQAYEGEVSKNLWYGTNPRSLGEAPKRDNIGVIWDAFNTEYRGGPGLYAPTVEPPTPTPEPNPNDNTPPSASGFSVSISDGTAYLSVSGVQDNPGGSGIREVRYSAKYSNQWRGIGVVTYSSYSLSWDMCADSVPDGDIEFGMEVWDNSGNKYVWSEHQPNPHRTKSYNCSPPPPQEGVFLFKNTGYGGAYMCPIYQDVPSLSSYCGNDWNDEVESVLVKGPYYFALYRDDNYGGGQPFSGNPSGDLPGEWRDQTSSVRVRRSSPQAFTLYDLGDYNGVPWSSDRTVFDFSHWNWNDRAQSIRVGSGYGVIVCEHADFKGVCGRTTGPAEWADINAFAEGLRDNVSSVRVCNGACPEAGNAPTLIFPPDGGIVDSGKSTTLQWTGDLTEFQAELWGGGLDNTRTYGWTSAVAWDVGVLPESSNPYYWKVRGWRGYGETGWSSGSFYVVKPDNTPPTGVVTQPLNNSYQRGPTVTIEVEASDVGTGVEAVWFYGWIDDHWESIGVDTSAPYQSVWNITNVRDGTVWVSASVADKAGNQIFIWDPNWRSFIIDKTPPSSTVYSLPEIQTNQRFIVRWGGSDNYTPTDLIFYSVEYQTNCTGDWLSWLTMSNLQADYFNGEYGKSYCFRSQGIDLPGNVEAWPDQADAHTSVQMTSPLATPTKTPTRTPTKTPTPTRTPTPTPTPTPGRLFLPFVSYDLFPPSTLQFDDDYCGNRVWPVLDTSNYSMDYIELSPCQYQIWVKSSQYYAWATPGTIATNFMVEGHLESFGSNGRSGLIFGLSADGRHFYAMTITATGYYALFRYDDGNWEYIIPTTHSSLIHEDSPNILTLISMNEQISLFLNSGFVDAVIDDRSHAGRLGLFADTSSGNFSARYSRFTVWNADLKAQTRGQESPDSGGAPVK